MRRCEPDRDMYLCTHSAEAPAHKWICRSANSSTSRRIRRIFCIRGYRVGAFAECQMQSTRQCPNHGCISRGFCGACRTPIVALSNRRNHPLQGWYNSRRKGQIQPGFILPPCGSGKGPGRRHQVAIASDAPMAMAQAPRMKHQPNGVGSGLRFRWPNRSVSRRFSS